MYILVIESRKDVDDYNNIITIPGATLQLEHSLISLQKWEAIWHKPWIDNKQPKTREESLSYIECMTINKNVSNDIYDRITDQQLLSINNYIDDPMTASKIDDSQGKSKMKKLQQKNTHESFISAELIYYWMIAFHIPFECRKWHLNQLLTLIKVCAAKEEEKDAELEASSKGINKVNATNWRQTAQSFKAENERRRKLWHTKG